MLVSVWNMFSLFMMCEQTFKRSSEAKETKTVGNVLPRVTCKTVWWHHTGVCGGMTTVHIYISCEA